MKRLLAGHANGEQIKEVAAGEYISYSTAHNTVHLAKRRLEARNLAQAVTLAIAFGHLSVPTGPDLSVFPID